MPIDPVPDLYQRAAEALAAEFGTLPPYEWAAEAGADPAAMAAVLETVAHRLGDNYPYFHPLYAGQMLKPPHPVARAAYALAMAINPNNHARDGGRASSEMEIEAVEEIAKMFGWRGGFLEGLVFGAPDLGWHDGESRSALGGRGVGAGEADCWVGAGALHAPTDFARSEARLRRGCGGSLRADAAGRPGR